MRKAQKTPEVGKKGHPAELRRVVLISFMTYSLQKAERVNIIDLTDRRKGWGIQTNRPNRFTPAAICAIKPVGHFFEGRATDCTSGRCSPIARSRRQRMLKVSIRTASPQRSATSNASGQMRNCAVVSPSCDDYDLVFAQPGIRSKPNGPKAHCGYVGGGSPNTHRRTHSKQKTRIKPKQRVI